MGSVTVNLSASAWGAASALAVSLWVSYAPCTVFSATPDALAGNTAPAASPVASAAASATATKKASQQTLPPATKLITKPEWHELSASQQNALTPLAAHWITMTEGQKRKWLVISKNFAAWPAAEQKLIHDRMTDWTSLSARQRSRARLNYAGAQELSPEERRSKWQDYQSLSPEQKKNLASTAAVKPMGAATAIKPISPQKLTMVPSTANNAAAPEGHRMAKIATGLDQLDPHTLLPLRP